MKERLPEGWVDADLENLCNITTGKKDVNEGSPDGKYPFFTCAQTVYRIDDFAFEGKALLIAGNGFFNVKHYDGRFNAYQRTYVLQDFIINDRYLYWYVFYRLDVITKDNRGSTVKYIRLGDLANHKVVIPPLNEQKRIVARLDQIIPRIDDLKARLDNIPTIIKRFRQSVLTAAVTGRLTEKWREDHSDVEEWREIALGSIIQNGPQNGLYKSQEHYGKGVLILRIDNFYDGYINSWNTLKRLALTSREKESYRLFHEDIVINRVNSMPFLGKSALVRNLKEPCVFESNMMRIQVDKDQIFPEYLIRYLNCQLGLFELRKNAKHAVNQSSINQQDVKAVKVPLPPLEEQKEIVRQVERLFSLADKLEAHYQNARARVDKLTRSVLAKAFRGELAPRDPNDEPAEKLLERILAEKEKMEAAVKKSRKKKQNEKTKRSAAR